MPVYTARKVNPRIENGLFRVVLEILADGEVVKREKLEAAQSMPDSWLRDVAKNRINMLQTLAEMVTNEPEGDITIPADPPPPPAPTAAEIAQDAWQADYRRFQTAYMLVQAGVLAANNVKYVALKDRLKTNVKPEYLDLG